MVRYTGIAAIVVAILLVAVPVWADNAVCLSCHTERGPELAASSHSGLNCTDCHTDAANHGGNMSAKTYVPFDLETCAGCHPDQYNTYVYGDDWKTKYGGSPLQYSKLNDFAHYNDIIDGYGFTKEYNEERSHNVMIQDHYDVSRGKKDTCLQCKSTKLAYYWDSGKELLIENDTYVNAGHMTEGITVPKGTKVSMYTARDAAYPYTHEARVLVTLPNGTMYSSYDYPGATRNGTWTWSALYALTVNELPAGAPTRMSGNGCNHCHNPHKVGRDAATGELVGFRIIRKSLKYAISQHGINPYEAGSPTVFNGDTPLTQAEGVALCAQCHVEYVCGDSPIDKIDRDYFSWAKVFDLETVYSTTFPGYDGPYTTADMKYVQDWVHGTGGLASTNPDSPSPYNTPFPITEELIKSQHPEAETYWNSRHYDNGAACFVCHMPKVTKADGSGTFTSHWLASPVKYMTPEPAAAFAAAVGVELNNEGIIVPCGACHNGKLSRMADKANRIQDGIYADALAVEQALVDSLAAIKAAKDGGGDPALIAEAAELHRAAHVRWENLVVSENSMGFHNPTEVSTELHNALSFAQSAKQKAEDSLGSAPPPADCTSYGDQATCEAAGCRWNRNKGCQ